MEIVETIFQWVLSVATAVVALYSFAKILATAIWRKDIK